MKNDACTAVKRESTFRVLIIGEGFTRANGGGVTLGNLFRDFPRDSLATIFDANQVSALDPDGPTHRVYALGSKEKFARFPFNIFKQSYASGGVDFNELRTAKRQPINHSRKLKFRRSLLSALYRLLLFFGLPYWIFRFRVSDELQHWIEDFAPTHIYAQFNTMEMLLFLSEIHRRFPVKLIVHFMDDWPSIIVKPGPLSLYWRRRFNEEIRAVLARSDHALSISEGMSSVYQARYAKEFQPFHNPIDLDFWGEYTRVTRALSQPVILLYAGRIGLGASETLVRVAEAVESLSLRGLSIQFHLQVNRTSCPDAIEKRLQKYSAVKFVDPVPYDELPKRFSAADMLLLPYDFDPEGMSFIKYSMPTKASEYMISGTPVVLIAPKETFIAEHAVRHQWADWIDSDNVEVIASRLAALLSDAEKRARIARAAVRYSENNFSADIVRQRFINIYLDG